MSSGTLRNLRKGLGLTVATVGLAIAINASGMMSLAGAPAAATPPAEATAAGDEAILPGSFGDVVAAVSPAVVNVSVAVRPAGGLGQMAPGELMQGQGSGFIIDSGGLIVTNNHVVDGAEGITVTLEDGRRFDATLVGRDARTDLALISIDAGAPLPSVRFGDSDGMRVGDWIIAVGNPFGLGGTVTTGIISAHHRDINSGPYDDYLQLDAAINRGNSGGPTFNLDGEVIGINTAIFSPNGGSVGIGFAVPSNLASEVIADLQDDGRVERGYLGVSIQEITPALAEALGLDDGAGALVAEVTKGGPAAQAGLTPGDVIVSFDDQAIDSARDLPRLVAELAPGSTATIGLLRQGASMTETVTIGELTDS